MWGNVDVNSDVDVAIVIVSDKCYENFFVFVFTYLLTTLTAIPTYTDLLFYLPLPLTAYLPPLTLPLPLTYLPVYPPFLLTLTLTQIRDLKLQQDLMNTDVDMLTDANRKLRLTNIDLKNERAAVQVCSSSRT